MKEFDSDLIRTEICRLINSISNYETLSPSSIVRLRNFAHLYPTIFNYKFWQEFLKHLYKLIEVVANRIRKEKDFKTKYTTLDRAQQQVMCLEFFSFLCNVLSFQNEENEAMTAQQTYEQKSMLNQLDGNLQHSICIEIINLFTEMSVVDSTYVEFLFRFLLKAEAILDTYGAFKFYEPIRRFFLRNAQATVEFVLKHFSDHNIFRIFKYLITGESGAPFRAVMSHNSSMVVAMLRIHAVSFGKCYLFKFIFLWFLKYINNFHHCLN